MIDKNDSIEKLTDDLFVCHKLNTPTEREVLREMVEAVLVGELCARMAEKMGGVN